jgi:hypothetical protein
MARKYFYYFYHFKTKQPIANEVKQPSRHVQPHPKQLNVQAEVLLLKKRQVPLPTKNTVPFLNYSDATLSMKYQPQKSDAALLSVTASKT